MRKANNRTVHPASRIQDIKATTRPEESSGPGELGELGESAVEDAAPVVILASVPDIAEPPTEVPSAPVDPVDVPVMVSQNDSAEVLGLGDGLVFPDAPPGEVRRVEVSKRGKRDFNYSWARADVAVMRAAHGKYMPLYRRMWQERDPGGSYRLVFSAFVARALMEAFNDVDAWVHTIRNDARKEPVEGGREQVGLVWPVEVENLVVEAWETFDRGRLPSGFALTKQHLASAAILHGLKSADRWVLAVGNDDRFNVPVRNDGRLRENRADAVTA